MGYIYIATNKVNGKQYIGLTKRSLKKRMLEHIRKAINYSDIKQYGLGFPFYNAIRKYGQDNFDWEIIDEFPDVVLTFAEKKYIKMFNTKIPNGYNSTDGGEGTSGRFVSEKEIDKRKKSAKDRAISVVCLETGKEYFSLNDAWKDTGINKTSIKKCCDGTLVSTHGTHWKYSNSNITLEQIESSRKRKLKKPNQIYIKELNKIFVSINEASKEIGCHPTTMLYALKRNNVCKGYHCYYYSQQDSQEMANRN